MPPFAKLEISASGIVACYSAIGLGWAIALTGSVTLSRCLSGFAAMALAGAVVASRSMDVPAWLSVSIAAVAALALLLNAQIVLQDIRSRQGSLSRRVRESLIARIPGSVRMIAAKEVELWTAVFSPSSLGVKYSRLAQFPMGKSGSDAMVMKVLVGIGLIELFAVHLIVHAFYPMVALILTSISAIGLIYLFAIARSLALVPTTLSSDDLTIRLGVLRQQIIALAQIEAVGPAESDQVGRANTLTFAIIDPPNVRLQLNEPIVIRSLFGNSRSCHWVDFRTDYPVQLIQAINSKIVTHSEP